MRFADHPRLQGEHSFLGASRYHWINYDDERLAASYRTAMAAARGTRLHALAAEHIRLGMRMPRNRATFNAYVNDAIGYRMVPEQVLFYSVNSFGTADAISFDERSKLLRIHDLKTGVTPASMAQLHVYAALFCLEYDKSPFEIKYDLRIYQNDEIAADETDPEEISRIMAAIRHFDKIIEELKEAE
jgi:hypothetical protein